LSDYELALKQVSYVRADFQQLHVLKDDDDFIVRGNEFVFTNYQLGYFFFTLLKRENDHENAYTVLPDEELHLKVNRKMIAMAESCNHNQNSKSFSFNRRETMNNLVRRLKIPRAFSYGVNHDFDDNHVIDKIRSSFNEDGAYPSASVCICKIHDVLCSYIQAGQSFEKSNNIETAVSVFLNSFFVDQQSDLVQFAISQFFKSTWSS